MRDLKKAVAKAAAQTKVNLRKAGQGLSGNKTDRDKVPRTTKPPKSLRILQGIEGGSGGDKVGAPYLGKRPLYLGRCNYDILSPKRRRDAVAMEQGSADEAIVVVKLAADDVRGNTRRGENCRESGKEDAGGEGWNMLTT